MKTEFDKECKDFFRDRRRWKSDFDVATERANSNYGQIESIINNCLTQNNFNTQSIKLLLDSQMIAQLIEKQDNEDKKQIGIFGTKTNRQILNHGANERLTSFQNLNDKHHINLDE